MVPRPGEKMRDTFERLFWDAVDINNRAGRPKRSTELFSAVCDEFQASIGFVPFTTYTAFTMWMYRQHKQHKQGD